MRSCDSRTKLSLGLNCTTWRSYIQGGLVLGITLLVPPTTTVLLHLPPTIGVALVAFESAINHMCEASIRGPHQSHSASHNESEGSRNGRPHFVSYPNPYSKSPIQRDVPDLCVTFQVEDLVATHEMIQALHAR